MGLRDRLLGGSSRQRIEELESRVQGLTEMRSIDTLPWNVGAETSVRTPTPKRALRLAPVFAAVSLIARNISTLPLQGYRRAGSTGAITRMPYLPQLFQSPSIHGGLVAWLHRYLTSLLLDGNAYGLITQRDGYGFPTMIEWLDPQQVSVVDEGQWGRGSYWDPIYYWRGREIQKENLVHVPFFAIPFRVRGLSPLGAFASAVDIGLSGQEFAGDWYKAGGMPPGTFKNSAQKVGDTEASAIRGRLVSSIRLHEPLVYGADWDYKPIQINPSDAIFVETHQLSATDIASVYGVYPAERIGGVTKSAMTYANVEAEQIQFIQLTLLPYVSTLESVLFDLLPEPQYVKFNLNSQIRTDTRSRHEIHKIDREIGLKNIDEIRSEEDMTPLPNGEGKVYDPLIVVRETIKATAQSQTNPNEPGFQTAPPGVTEPGVAPAPGQPTAAPPATNGTNGRFTGSADELTLVGRSAREGEDDDLPPF